MIKPLHGGVEFILTAPHCYIRNPIEMNGNSRRGRNMLERGTRNAEQAAKRNSHSHIGEDAQCLPVRHQENIHYTESLFQHLELFLGQTFK